ncbi:MAG: ABC transporter ATP-binding protein [Tagaea sp.]|nr:ABC transporter ATP-binding protein [Tagaea sp.]
MPVQSAKSVTFEGVAKRFGAVTAVERVDLDVQPGQFVTLLGPSGCGKSTTLNMIAGLEQPSEGRIRIGDRDVTHLPPSERDIAMVFQSYALYPHLSVFENIAFPLRARRRRTAEPDLRARVAQVAAALGLDALLERLPREISGGQRQRVALGRAMVRTPTVYLLDEPLSNLDQQLRVQMRSELKDIHQRLGATMIYVTHDQGEAMTLSDTIVVMSGGRVEQLGSPRELYDRPANVFVARFLGEPGMNLFEGRVSDGALRGDGVAIPAAGLGARGDGGMLAGIRPEDLVAVEPDAAPLKGVVRTVEFLGSRMLVRVDVGSSVVAAFMPLGTRLAVRERVGLAPSSPDRVRWFAAASGKAIF